MTIQTWLLYLAVALVPVLSPGPAILLALSNAIRFGTRATVYSALGNALGLSILGLAVALGIGALMRTHPEALALLRLLGGAYLVYLGIRTWRDESRFGGVVAGPAPEVPGLRLFGQAFMVAITNAKAVVLLAALFPPFLDETRPLLLQAVILVFTYAVLCFLNHLGIALAAGRLRRSFASPQRMRQVRRAVGAIFVGFGILLALIGN